MSSLFTTIGGLIGGIPQIYGNRQDLASTADGSASVRAMVAAIDELTETYEFEELKVITPVPPLTTLQMTAGQPIIPIASLIATIQQNLTLYPQFTNQNILDLTDVYTFWMWFQGGVNQAGRNLEYRRVTTVDQDSYGITSNTQGAIGTAPPVYYTRFGNILQVGPAPDQNYNYFVRFKIRHPFPFNSPFTAAVLTPTVVGGAITAVTVNSGGAGYIPNLTNIPLYFSSPVSGLTASGTATSNSSGVITSVTVTSGGSNYFNATNAFVNTAVSASQLVFVPNSWREILQYAACWRLATWNGSEEYIQMFNNVLASKMGDVQEARTIKSQMKRDERHNSRALSLRLGSPYTFARR